jgi:hypothetical protein
MTKEEAFQKGYWMFCLECEQEDCKNKCPLKQQLEEQEDVENLKKNAELLDRFDEDRF